MTRPVRVLTHPGVDGGRPNATVAMLVASLPDDISVLTFRWRRAFGFGYDVLHIHWLELVIRHRSPLVSTYRKALFLVLMVRLLLLRTPAVWTVHNDRPHENEKTSERLLLGLWARVVTRRVYMYRTAIPESASRRSCYIPRGDYRPLYGTLIPEDGAGERGSLLLFGLLRPYKGIEDLIGAFNGLAPPQGNLRISGEALSADYADRLRHLCAGHPRIDLRIDHLPDDELAEQILESESVVLPYKHMYNSGAALLALTLRRPIIVPGSNTMMELRDEVGDEWVSTYSGDLTSESLTTCLDTLRDKRTGTPPDMARRDWREVGEQYAALFRDVLGR